MNILDWGNSYHGKFIGKNKEQIIHDDSTVDDNDDDDGRDDDDSDDDDDDGDEKNVRVDSTCGRENDFEIYLCHIEGSEAKSKGALQLG